ncbi:hypothetical protein RUM43_007203 [Polyplax serrata]|uniref:Uncharacterized protein n=1 Tax=Polyplax serrata TaxID=468196 RepID=A0AAN8PLY3_POLSC
MEEDYNPSVHFEKNTSHPAFILHYIRPHLKLPNQVWTEREETVSTCAFVNRLRYDSVQRHHKVYASDTMDSVETKSAGVTTQSSFTLFKAVLDLSSHSN